MSLKTHLPLAKQTSTSSPGRVSPTVFESTRMFPTTPTKFPGQNVRDIPGLRTPDKTRQMKCPRSCLTSFTFLSTTTRKGMKSRRIGVSMESIASQSDIPVTEPCSVSLCHPLYHFGVLFWWIRSQGRKNSCNLSRHTDNSSIFHPKRRPLEQK